MTVGAGPGVPEAPGIAARRRYLVRQALVALGAVVVLAVVVALLRPRAGTDRGPGPGLELAPLVLGLATAVVLAVTSTRWWADLGTTTGRALWATADREKVATVRAHLVQRMPLPPEDRPVGVALARAEASPPGRVAAAVELVGPAVLPAAVFAPELPATVAVVAILVVAAVGLGPRLWWRRRLFTGARAQGLLL